MSVCPLTTVHLIDVARGGCIAEDPRTCSVECEIVWMSGSPESCKQQYRTTISQPVPNKHVLNGHGSSLYNSSLNKHKLTTILSCSMNETASADAEDGKYVRGLSAQKSPHPGY